MKEKCDMEWWTYDHKEIKHEVEIMVLDKE
jgi:hypothetical protein